MVTGNWLVRLPMAAKVWCDNTIELRESEDITLENSRRASEAMDLQQTISD